MYNLILYMVCAVVAMIGTINWGLIGLLDFNVIKKINQKTVNSQMFENIFYTLIGVCGIYLATQRKYYLPFLGETVLPISVIKEYKQDKYDVEIKVTVPKEALHVIYWAANPANQKADVPNALPAYGKFENHGVSPVIDGRAILYINCPQVYKVGRIWSRVLPKHLHYRYVLPSGLLSSIETIPLTNQCPK